MSSMMDSIARANVHGFDGTYRAHEIPAPPPKRKTLVNEPQVNTLRELVNNGEGGGVGIRTLQLSKPQGSGRTKRQRTRATTGARLTCVEETSDFPYELSEVTVALENTVCSANLSLLSSTVPCLFKEPHIAKYLEKHSAQVSTGSVTRRLNFSIAPVVLTKLNEALKETKDRVCLTMKTVALAAARHAGAECVDLCESPKAATGYVVTAVPGLQGFSEEHVATLNVFKMVLVWYASYTKDVFWLRDKHTTCEKHIPYLQETLMRRADAHVDLDQRERDLRDPFLGAREYSRASLVTCTLATKFHIKTHRSELRGSIAIREVVGFLGRTVKLNDSVITFALRQMAGDYADVHVFDCLVTAAAVPASSIHAIRWAFFPLNLDNEHWGIACVNLKATATVYLYDPLQSTGGYEVTLLGRWTQYCLPLMTKWAARDGLCQTTTEDQTPFTFQLEYVRLARQADGSSCGVYVVALASELIAESTFFRDQHDISLDEIVQMRVRMLWRILCDSERQDHSEDELQATRTMREVENFQAGTGDKGKKKMKGYFRR